GDPFEEEIIWGSNIPFADVGYYFQGGGPYYPMVSTLGPGNPIIHIEFTPDLYDVVEFDLDIPVGDGGSPSQESVNIIAGGLEFGICFDGGETLADAFAEFEYLWEDAENTPVWYDEETGGAVVPGSTKVEGGDEYYLDFDISGCDVRIPVKVDYKLDKPQAEMEQKFCSETALNLINIRDK